jgi:hypothetical protein
MVCATGETGEGEEVLAHPECVRLILSGALLPTKLLLSRSIPRLSTARYDAKNSVVLLRMASLLLSSAADTDFRVAVVNPFNEGNVTEPSLLRRLDLPLHDHVGLCGAGELVLIIAQDETRLREGLPRPSACPNFPSAPLKLAFRIARNYRQHAFEFCEGSGVRIRC